MGFAGSFASTMVQSGVFVHWPQHATAREGQRAKKNAPRSELSILITSRGGGRVLGEMLKHTHLEQRGD